MMLSVGQQIGSYRIVRPLGRGGMGAVYEVEHAQLGVHYALKTFIFEGGHDALLKNKFLAEGKVLARLHDPHLVRVFDLNFDETSGMLYFVMDLVLNEKGESQTLADVRTDELDEDRILEWFGELASALDYIHARGIVHRDVKLGNVLLDAERRVILSDFGVSRFFSQNLREEISAVNSMVSEVTAGARLAMGTRGYMAPEVARGEEATPAADVYSLGVMFVHLLTGIWYEPGSKVFKLLETMEHRWIDVLPRLLAENPQERPATLADLVPVLSRDSDSGHPAPSQGKSNGASSARQKPRKVVPLAVLAILAAVAVGLIIFLRRPSAASVDEFDSAFSARGLYEGSLQ